MSRPVARSSAVQRLDVMALLRAHVPLTLLVDLVLVDQDRPLEPAERRPRPSVLPSAPV